MHLSKKLKTGVAGMAAVVAFLGLGVSAASAVPAVWSSTGATTLTGNLTLSYAGQSSICAISMTPGASNSGSPLQARLTGDGQGGTCAGANQMFQMRLVVVGDKNGSAYSLTQTGAGYGGQNPFGSMPSNEYFWRGSWTVPVTNGSGATSTTVTFANTTLGLVGYPSAGYAPLVASGTLTLKKSNGSLLTLL